MKNLILKLLSLFKRKKKIYVENTTTAGSDFDIDCHNCSINTGLSWEINGQSLPVLKGDKGSYFVWARSKKTGNLYKQYITKQIKKQNESN